MTASLATFFALAGLTGISVGFLALAMPRHHATVFGHQAGALREQTLRFAGWFLLTASLLVAVAAGDGGIALVTWFALLTVQAFIVTLLLAYAPRWVPVTSGIQTLIVLVGTAIAKLHTLP